MQEQIVPQEVEFLSKKVLDLNQKLLESERAKSRFLSLIASELNNPMTALVGILPHLKIEQKEIYELLIKETMNLDFKIQNLVTAAEIESGSIDISHASFKPHDIFKDIVESLKYEAKERDISISLNDAVKSSLVSDPKMVGIIVRNLLHNACRYGSYGSMVEISFQKRGDSFIIEVSNEGQMPALASKQQIFNRFGDMKGGEHGLGIVKELCGYLDGSIDYESEEGSVLFRVILPCDKSSKESDAIGSNEFLFDSFDDTIEL